MGKQYCEEGVGRGWERGEGVQLGWGGDIHNTLNNKDFLKDYMIITLSIYGEAHSHTLII